MRRENVFKGVDHKYPSACGACKLNTLTMKNLSVTDQGFVWIFIIVGICALGMLLFYLVLRHRIRVKNRIEEGEIKEDGRTYEQDRFNRNLFYSLAYRQLRLLESYSPKHKDRMIVSTSRPHLFSEDKLREFYDSMPEISVLRIMNKHDIMVVKSPAADYGDFNVQLRQAVIQQLNENYIPGFQKDSSLNNQEKVFRPFLISKDVCLDRLSGNRIIRYAKDVFKDIDEKFSDWRMGKPGGPTPATPIKVEEVMFDGKLLDIFQALPGTWGDKKMTQDQVIEFCATLPDELREGERSMLFLVALDEKPINEESPGQTLVVVAVYFGCDSLRAYFFELRHEIEFLQISGRYCVVSPRFKL